MTLGESMTEWAARVPTVSGLVLIGSRARDPADTLWSPDAHSDWDFQIFTSRPSDFLRSDWAKELNQGLQTYAVRRTAIGRVPKIAAMFDGAEADFIIVPAKSWRWRRWLVSVGMQRYSPSLRRSLQPLALVVRPGWRFLKDTEGWEIFYRRVVETICDPRLGNPEVMALAEGFVSDARWIRKKIDRGELVAAQRMLHQALIETNFRLVHEARLRRGQRSFPEARRAEQTWTADELTALAVNAALEPASLRAAVERSSAACRRLVAELVGDAWRWPSAGVEKPSIMPLPGKDR